MNPPSAPPTPRLPPPSAPEATVVKTARRQQAPEDPGIAGRARSWISGPAGAGKPSTLRRWSTATGRWIGLRSGRLGDELYVGGRRLVSGARDHLRDQDRFYAWKAGIVGAWIALSVLALGIAGSGGPTAPDDNSLKAYVVATPSLMSWGLLIHNRSPRAWTSVEIVADGHAHRRPRVEPDERLVLGPEQFEAAIAASAPRLIAIRANEGAIEVDLASREGEP